MSGPGVAAATFGATAPKAFGAGGKGIRTPGLLIANETLYQLSYTPESLKRRCLRCRIWSAFQLGVHPFCPPDDFRGVHFCLQKSHPLVCGIGSLFHITLSFSRTARAQGRFRPALERFGVASFILDNSPPPELFKDLGLQVT